MIFTNVIISSKQVLSKQEKTGLVATKIGFFFIQAKKTAVFLANGIDFSFYEEGILYLSTCTKWAV